MSRRNLAAACAAAWLVTFASPVRSAAPEEARRDVAAHFAKGVGDLEPLLSISRDPKLKDEHAKLSESAKKLTADPSKVSPEEMREHFERLARTRGGLMREANFDPEPDNQADRAAFRAFSSAVPSARPPVTAGARQPVAAAQQATAPPPIGATVDPGRRIFDGAGPVGPADIARPTTRPPAVVGAPVKPRVVVLGDSLSTRYFGFGPTMYDQLSQSRPDAAVQMYAYGASAPRHFLPGTPPFKSPNVYTPGAPARPNPSVAPKLDEVLGPDAKAVVVVLGTNLIDMKGVKNWRPRRPGEAFDPSKFVSGIREVQTMAQHVHASGSKLLWVGPPDMRGYKGTDPGRMRQVLRYIDGAFTRAIGDRGVYIPSSDITRYEGNDGIHQSAAAGRAWAAALLEDPRFAIPK